MLYVSFQKEKSHSLTFSVCAYMLHDNLAKLLWNTQLKNKILSSDIYHGYEYEENTFCPALPFRKITLECVEFFRPVSERFQSRLSTCLCRLVRNQARSICWSSTSCDLCSSNTLSSFFFSNVMQSRPLRFFFLTENISFFCEWFPRNICRFIFKTANEQ